jgi:hypothetical protein
MDTLVGLLELLAWIVAILMLSASVTYGVIKLTKVWEARRKSTEEAGSSP